MSPTNCPDALAALLAAGVRIRRLVLPLAAAAAAALGLAHAVRHAVPGLVRRTVLIHLGHLPDCSSGRAADPGALAPRVHSALNSCFHFLLLVVDAHFFPTLTGLVRPRKFAEMEPDRFSSVGGNGIKLYSNIRPNASCRCDQSANCSCATWIPQNPLRLQSQWSCQHVIAGYGRSYPVALLANAFRSRAGIAANPPVRLVRCIRIEWNPPHPAKSGASCRHRKEHTVVGTHSRFTRQDDHTPNRLSIARKTFGSGDLHNCDTGMAEPVLRRNRPRAVAPAKYKGCSAREQPCDPMASQRPPESSRAGAEPEGRRSHLRGCISSRHEHRT